jgi:uncharacterized protein (DUF2062 family)
MSRFNIKAILLGQIRQGTSPHELALSVSIALCAALFPLLGTTTLLCLVIGHFKKLNHPALQSVNYLLSPVQLVMIPIWLRIGEWLTRSPPVSLNLRTFVPEFFQNMPLFMAHYGVAALHAILAWSLISPLLGYLSYRVTLPLLRRVSRGPLTSG